MQQTEQGNGDGDLAKPARSRMEFRDRSFASARGWTRMILTIFVECCGNYGQDAAKSLILWRPRRDLNPCYRRERAMS